jgi:hypothetical protein
MLSKQSLTIISESIALYKFDMYCKRLDQRFSDALNAAFEPERISKERTQRIGNRFLDNLHEVERWK